MNKLSLEDKCFSLIMIGEINSAYKEIAQFESQQPFPRGLNINWPKESEKGLNQITLNSYEYTLALDCDVPRHLITYKKSLNACIIIGDMLGISNNEIAIMFERICDIEVDKIILQNSIGRIKSLFYTKRTMDSYRQLGVKEYQLLATYDTSTCKVCAKLDGNIFNILDAKVGVNSPPICDSCRCTIIPYYEGNVKTKFARDKNGKGIYIPGDMSYEEWHQTYISEHDLKDNTDNK